MAESKSESKSESWRKLAAEFRALNCPGIRLTWIIHPEDYKPEFYLHLDANDPSGVQSAAMALFAEAGMGLDRHYQNPISLWMEGLIEHSPGDKPLIEDVCIASAVRCSNLQMRAMKDEQELAVAAFRARDASLKRRLSEGGDPILNLHAIGLDIDIPEESAAKIWAELLIIDGRASQGFYRSESGGGIMKQHLFDAYHAIAQSTVTSDTPDEYLETTIPAMVYAFKLWRRWNPQMGEDTNRLLLRGPATEWKGKRLLMSSAALSSPQAQRNQFYGAALPDLDAEVERDAQKQIKMRKRIQDLTPPEPREILDEREFVRPPGIPVQINETAGRYEEQKTPIPRKKRAPATITSHYAAERMQSYIEDKGMGQEEFAQLAGTTARTLLTFRTTGKVRKDIFGDIAKAMGITRDEFMNSLPSDQSESNPKLTGK